MKKFTGDKWSFNVNRGIIFKHDNPLIRICSLVAHQNEEYKANGRLIAAAPEMYSLLCRFLHDTYPANENSFLQQTCQKTIALFKFLNNETDKLD